jgi:hypothetical protein
MIILFLSADVMETTRKRITAKYDGSLQMTTDHDGLVASTFRKWLTGQMKFQNEARATEIVFWPKSGLLLVKRLNFLGPTW